MIILYVVINLNLYYLITWCSAGQILIDYQNIPSLYSVSFLSSLTLPASNILRHEALIIVNKGNRNKNLGPYLAGLIEGDGSIIVPNKPFSPNGSVNRGGFEICFNIKDLALAESLQKLLGGFLRIRGQACILYIRNIDTVFNLINLINGHMRTPKIEDLHRLIIWFNKRYNTDTPLLYLDESPLQIKSWLSGFLDADASFYLNWSINKKELPISLLFYLRITQRQMYHRESQVGKSYLYIMTKIAKFLSTTLQTIKRNRKTYLELGYELKSGGINSNYIINSYLMQYPLFSYKYTGALVNIELLQLSIYKKHKTIEGPKILQKLKNEKDSYNQDKHLKYIATNFYY